MRNRFQVALAVVAVMLAGVMAWQALGPPEREPEYQGKRLSVWLGRYDHNAGRFTVLQALSIMEADEAVRQIGTNAIPVLLRRLRARDSRLTIWVMALIQKQNAVKIRYTPASIRRREGLAGFEALGANTAKAAVPLLLTYLKDHDPAVRHCVCDALKAIDPEAAAKAGVK